MAAQHEILGGKVQLFKRPNSPFWNARASVEGHQFRKSTKTDSLAQAKDVAEDWYLDLKGVAKYGGGLPKKGKPFREVAEKFLDEFETITEGQRSPRYVDLLRKKINTHLNAFFGDKPITAVTDSLVQEYRVHRNKHVDKHGKPARPARTTIHHEIIALGHVLKTAKRHGWIQHLPNLKAPYKTSGKFTRRAWFSPEEYKRFREAAKARVAQPPHPKWRWEYEQFYDYILFVANSGLRAEEAGNLEFRDVEIVQNDKVLQIDTLEQFRKVIAHCKEKGLPEPILKIDIRGKRGVRVSKSMPGAVRPFIRLRTRLRAVREDPSKIASGQSESVSSRRLRGAEPRRLRAGNRGISRGQGPELRLPVVTDRVFGPTQRALMNEILQELELKFDRDGQRRSANSLRHTYICFRLLEGAEIYPTAKNCGTSVEIIEDYYAAHIASRIDESLINVRRVRQDDSELLGLLSAEVE
jgi:integrase